LIETTDFDNELNLDVDIVIEPSLSVDAEFFNDGCDFNLNLEQTFAPWTTLPSAYETLPDDPALEKQSKPDENLGLADTQSLCESTLKPTPSSSPSQETPGLRCAQCPELSPFKRPRDFNKHMNKHLRPYRCEEGRCNRRFSTSTSAKRHHASIHRKARRNSFSSVLIRTARDIKESKLLDIHPRIQSLDT
jgi:hypothetical protein